METKILCGSENCHERGQEKSLKNEKNNYKYSCFIGGIGVEFCMDSDTIPCGNANLAVKGAKALIEALPCEEREAVAGEGGSAARFSIAIEKRLPVAAGLAGGSGNAACVMLAMNALLGNPLTLEELISAGKAIGADVPFSLMMNANLNSSSLKDPAGIEKTCRAAVVTGIGEKVLPAMPLRRHLILMNPGIAVSTEEVYDAMDELLPEHSPNPKLFYNIMESYTLSAYEPAAEMKRCMEHHFTAAEHILMSGSGPTIAAYFKTAEEADAALHEAASAGWIKENWILERTETGGEVNDI